jgi:hypothetical protein
MSLSVVYNTKWALSHQRHVSLSVVYNTLVAKEHLLYACPLLRWAAASWHTNLVSSLTGVAWLNGSHAKSAGSNVSPVALRRNMLATIARTARAVSLARSGNGP